MADIKALFILAERIKSFQNVQTPPRNLDEVDSYGGRVKKALKDAQTAVSDIKSYIEKVEKTIDKLKEEQQILIQKNQDAIQEIFDSLISNAKSESVSEMAGTGRKNGKRNRSENGNRNGTAVTVTGGKGTLGDKSKKSPPVYNPALKKLEKARKLQEIAHEVLNNKLGKLITETENACAKLKDGMDLSDNDIAELNGCLQSWKNAKMASLENEQRASKARKEKDEKAKKERARENRDEEEGKQRQRNAEHKNTKQKTGNKQSKPIEIKFSKEEEEEDAEEAEDKEEEIEQRLKDDQICEEMEIQKAQDEEKRKKQEREEEETRKQLEEEKKRQEKEAETQRLEAEEREKARLKKEAEERAWRQDPNNWNNMTYSRDSGEVDGKHAYHGGINCIISSPPGTIEKDDIECTASDEVDSVIKTLDIDEKPVSSIIDIHSNKGTLHSEVPARIYIPHHSAFSSDDEAVVKVSLNQNSWVTVSPVPSTSNMEEQEGTVQGMACFEVNDFNRLRAIVVTRPRCQTIIVDKPGISIHSTKDRKVHLHVPRYAFGSRTEMKLMVQSVSERALGTFVKENNDLDNILSVSSIVTLLCGKQPVKAIEVDINSSQKENRGKVQCGKTYQLYTSMDRAWKFADIEVKGHQDDITVVLPPGREQYTIMELDVPSSFPRESVPSMAAALQTCMNKTVVVVIIKQHKDDLNNCVVRVVRRDICLDTLNVLTENGYTEGPDTSHEFILQEGQELEFNCTGNIENRIEKDGHKFTYLSYMGGVATDMTLQVKDSCKQKYLQAYVGTIRCTVLNKKVHSEILCLHAAELKISLPKQVKQQVTVSVAKVRVPFYLATLASYLSHNLCDDDNGMWEQVLKSLLGSSDFSSAYRNAKRKTAAKDEESVCKTMLLDWMKAQAIYVDKLYPITVALTCNGYNTLADSCVDFVRVQKENLKDTLLIELAQGITKDIHTLGKDLGLDNTEIERCIKQHPNDIKGQYIAEMMEWRESEGAIQHSDNALEYLRNICV